MLDLRLIREHPDDVRRAIRAKQLPEAEASLDALLRADEDARLVRQDLEALQAERNASSREIGDRKRRGEDASGLMQAMSEVAGKVKRFEERSRSLELQVQELQLEIPNLPHPSVPYGESEHDNVVVKEWGDAVQPAFALKPHWELAQQRGWIDLEAGVRIAGAGFPVFRGAGSKLVRSLERFFIDELEAAGYEEIIVPLVANVDSATATGQLPDKEGQMYEITGGLFLIPTSEVGVTNLYRGAILDSDALPLRHAAFSACFRREAGNYGKEVRGLNRVHQFDKVEMVQFTRPEQSYQALEDMTRTAEVMLERLGLRYRKLLMCTGDMGFTQAKKYDLEVWSPGQDRWLEVSSISNLEAFQSTRMKTRARSGGSAGRGKPEVVHTLNGSALAFPRTIAAILETFQREDGSVSVPDVLRPYLRRDVLE